MNTRVLVARKQRDITQEALAESAGVGQPDITRIEKHGWTPPLEIQQRIATALDTTVEDLFGTPQEDDDGRDLPWIQR